MKKKYLALILSCIMCSSLFFTGCGKTAEEPVIEEDDDDEDEDEDDDDDKEDDDDDDKDDKNVYVESIDEETLAEQIKVFVKNKKLWTITGNESVELEDAAYCVTDLDHNGRCELLVMTESAYSTVTDTRIFEITEKGDAFKEADWDYKGIQNVSGSLIPDFIYYPLLDFYFDEKEETCHYILGNSFDNGNGEYGNLCCDVEYSNSVADVNTYLYIKINQSYDPDTWEYDYKYTYGTPDGEIEEETYNDILSHYPPRIDLESVYFGIYYRGWYDDFGVMNLEDSFLVSVLTDSYKVFSGELDYSEFYGTYNDVYAPADTETYYEQYIGFWGLYESETEGDVNNYTSSSNFYRSLEFDNDSRVTLTVYDEGKIVLVYAAEVYMDENMDPYFEITDSSILNDGIVCERYTVTGMNSDKDLIYVSFDFYGEDGYLGGSSLKFIKDWE
ncbi:MAG: hypothetical protein J5696_11095 [Lachnospiraceae bacterium]|nr:hypothetical protein [Lachnospiraceae bacterium]